MWPRAPIEASSPLACCSSLKGGVNLALFHSLPTQELCSPPPPNSGGMIGSQCPFSKFSFALWFISYQLLLQGELRALRVTPGHYLLPHPVPWSLCQKRTHVGLDGPFSLPHGCVWKPYSWLCCFSVLGLGVWEFFLQFTERAVQCYSSLCNPPPHLRFSSVPFFNFIKSTETGKLWSQRGADLLVDKTGIKLSLLKPEEI